MRQRAVAVPAKIFFKFCNTMICCLGCANDGVAAMVVVAAVVVAAVVVAEKFQKFSKIFNFFLNLITSQCCSAGGGTVVAQLQ